MNSRILIDSHGQEGSTLLTTLVALGILAIIGVPFLSALTTSEKSTETVRDAAMMNGLATAQMEWVKNANYIPWTEDSPPLYEQTDLSLPAGYSIEVDAQPLNGSEEGIQVVTITVTADEGNSRILTNYKVNR